VQNVTPPESPVEQIVMMQASHFDPDEAYAAVDRIVWKTTTLYYRTRDAGKTCSALAMAARRGLYADRKGRFKAQRAAVCRYELGVYVSFNDGGRMASLQLNLPPVSMRDLAIHGDDLIVPRMVAASGPGRHHAVAAKSLTNSRSPSLPFRPADAIRMHRAQTTLAHAARRALATIRRSVQ